MRVLVDLKTAVVLLSVLGLSACKPSAHHADDLPRVETEQGLVQGVRVDDIFVFKGIPYAAAPVGALRWRSPRAPQSWSGVRDASTFGPPCPTIDGARMHEGKQLSGAYDIFIDTPMVDGASEDCLHLNVWAPVHAKDAPVMVWIQPLGSASHPVFDGAAFARDGVVLVTMDYRQLTLGNFAHPALTKQVPADEPLGRFQTMDQIAALRWVNQNIASFGGDPRNVTVFGQSAGGAATLQLLTIPETRGLIAKAIVQSGNGWWSPFTQEQMERVGVWVAQQAGLPGRQATPDQLRALAPESFAQLGIYSIDGRMQRESATTAIEAGKMADVPLLIGWTDFDGSSLRRTSASAYAEEADEAVRAAYETEHKSGEALGYQMYTDNHAAAPARWIASKAQDGAPAYLYVFSYVRTAQRGTRPGAAHGEDIPFVFGTWDSAYPEAQLSDEDRAAARSIRSCWVSFARTGKPACDGAPEWPRYTRSTDQLMELGTEFVVRQNYRRRQLDAQEAAMQSTIEKASQSVERLLREMAAE